MGTFFKIIFAIIRVNSIVLSMWLFKYIFQILLFTATYVIASSQIWFLQNINSFEDKAKEAWINLEYLKNQSTISRYDVTRLLNAVECVDCINPGNEVITKYTNNFWDDFSALPGKDFNDIFYKKAIYKNESYYYCVATVADKSYMFWYPILTSPLCPGNFCWENNMSKWEFIQVVTNILSKYIEKNYTTDWKRIQSRYQKQTIWTYSYNIFNETDQSIINNKAAQCENEDCSMWWISEFRTYLKYCMFNINDCDMQEFWWITQWYRPISELNIALKENIIDYNESFINTIHKPIDWKTAVDAFWRIFSKVQCSFNNDYDCDWVKNSDDNCPNHYNPKQIDTDWDKVWDVCDEDIDWDWVKNPIGIVDERWSVNIWLRAPTTDNCIFIINAAQSDSNNNYLWDSCDLSSQKWVSVWSRIIWTWYNMQLHTYVIASYKPIESTWKRTINWQTFNWKEVYYPIKKSWTYDIYVQSTNNPSRKASQSLIINYDKWYIWSNIILSLSKTYLPTILTIKLQKTWNSEKTIRNLEWPENQQKITTNNVSEVPFLLRKAWSYKITATLKNWEDIISISSRSFTITEENNLINNITINNTSAKVWDQIRLNTKDNVQKRNIDRWDNTKQEIQQNNTNHIYQKEWIYVIQSTLVLNNNITIYDYKTISIINEQKQIYQWLENKISTLESSTKWSISLAWIRIWYTKEDILSQQFFDWILFSTWTINSINKNTPGIYHPETKEILWLCKITSHQSTIIVNEDNNFSCINMKVNNIVQCDFDKDWIDDRCDDDIDWDWIKNPIWLIVENHPSCDINQALIDKSKRDAMNNFLQNHWDSIICELLDNCPLNPNSQQEDWNSNGIWNICEWNQYNFYNQNWNSSSSATNISDDINDDSDNDWIPNNIDTCPDIQENYNWYQDSNWCPELGDNNPCDNTDVLGDSFIWFECIQCPCQYAQENSDINPGDIIRATLWSLTWSILQSRSETKTL